VTTEVSLANRLAFSGPGSLGANREFFFFIISIASQRIRCWGRKAPPPFLQTALHPLISGTLSDPKADRPFAAREEIDLLISLFSTCFRYSGSSSQPPGKVLLTNRIPSRCRPAGVKFHLLLPFREFSVLEISTPTAAWLDLRCGRVSFFVSPHTSFSMT